MGSMSDIGILRQLHALPVLADGFLQFLFRLADVTAALVITAGVGGRRHSGLRQLSTVLPVTCAKRPFVP
jgi:hypothetical protein